MCTVHWTVNTERWMKAKENFDCQFLWKQIVANVSESSFLILSSYFVQSITLQYRNKCSTSKMYAASNGYLAAMGSTFSSNLVTIHLKPLLECTVQWIKNSRHESRILNFSHVIPTYFIFSSVYIWSVTKWESCQ